jgi:hypothetical protein
MMMSVETDHSAQYEQKVVLMIIPSHAAAMRSNYTQCDVLKVELGLIRREKNVLNM